MIHSPYGQFITSLWRGSESRLNVKIHVSDHYNEIKELLVNGLIVDKNGSTEKFNVLPIMCADLCFVKEVIGKCSCTSLYGFFYCKKQIKDWDKDVNKAQPQSMIEISAFGKKAMDSLGEHPDHSSKKFTEFQQSHFGQYVRIVLFFSD